MRYMLKTIKTGKLNTGRALVLVLAIQLLGFGPVADLLAADPLPSYADLVDRIKEPVVAIFATKVVEIDPSAQIGPPGPEGGPPGPMEEFFEKFFEDQPGRRGPVSALGTGFIIDRNGLILTNYHVVATANQIKIKLQNLKEYDAKVVGHDTKTDLALIQVKPDQDFPEPARLGDSEKLRVGDGVMAAGNPFGLVQTVTTGIISAKGRVIGAGPYDDFLQTDAAINPGNSGGPLFNADGEVVGVNTAIVATGQGISFAIPINLVRELLPQLKSGEITRGWIGVMIQEITPELARSFGLEESKGVLIADLVPGGPADTGGIKRGDVIESVNGEPVKDVPELSRLIANTKPHSNLQVAIVRNGKTNQVQVKTGTMPREETASVPSGPPPPEEKVAREQLGLAIQTLTPELAARLGLNANEKGVLVSGVEPMSKAERAGLEQGDLIKEVNRGEIKSVDEMKRRLKSIPKEEQEGVLLLVKRGEHTFYTVLQG